jgi:hypothetical protein
MRRRLIFTVALLVMSCVVAGVDAWLAYTAGQQPALFYVTEIVAALVWVTVGVYAVAIRPDRLVGGSSRCSRTWTNRRRAPTDLSPTRTFSTEWVWPPYDHMTDMKIIRIEVLRAGGSGVLHFNVVMACPM